MFLISLCLVYKISMCEVRFKSITGALLAVWKQATVKPPQAPTRLRGVDLDTYRCIKGEDGQVSPHSHILRTTTL